MQRGAQGDRAGSQREQAGQHAAAGQVQADQAGAGQGGHGSSLRVIRPARNAVRWATSQAWRAAAGSAANRWAAASAGEPGVSAGTPLPGGAALPVGTPAAFANAALIACCASTPGPAAPPVPA